MASAPRFWPAGQNLDAGAIQLPRQMKKQGPPRERAPVGGGAIEWRFGLRSDPPEEF